MSTLRERFETVSAGLRPGVRLVAVSKTRDVEEIRALYELGQRAFGENYPQELRGKAPLLPADIEWHFIGHLQRSNVKHVLPITKLIHGIDSLRLLDEVEKRAAAENLQADVLLQVHIAREETKHGFDPAEASAVDISGRTWPHVRIRGLMGMATNTEEEAVVRSEFKELSGLFGRMKATAPTYFDTLSMGMSSDAPWAMDAGSTLVRIGTALFGERPQP